MALIPIPVRSKLPVMLEMKRVNVIVRATRIERFAMGQGNGFGELKRPLGELNVDHPSLRARCRSRRT
jgi:hypothetical protein